MCWIQDGAGMRPVLPVFYVANEDDGAAVYRNSLPAAAAEVQTCLNRILVKLQPGAELLPVILAFFFFLPAVGYLLAVMWQTHNYERTAVTHGCGLLRHERG